MAVSDLYFNKINLESDNRSLSFGLWCEEISPAVPANTGTTVANAVQAHLNATLRDLLSTESSFQSVQSWRRFPTSSRAGFVDAPTKSGTRTGNTMPLNNALFIQLLQEAQDAKYNGGIFIGGCSELDASQSEWTSGFFGTQVAAFNAVLPTAINAVGGDSGQWRFVALSKAFLPSATPIGTPFDITGTAASLRVMTQRRRTTKVRGFSSTP